MRKQFDLNYYLEHPETKVVTRGGRSVRIICTNVMSSEETNKVVGLIRLVDYEGVQIFYPNGLVFKNSQHCYDLFFDLPEPEKKKVPLTYEDLVKRIETGKTMWMQLEYAPGCYKAFNIISFNHVGIKYEEELIRYKDLVNNRFTFINGDLCWKEVEE